MLIMITNRCHMGCPHCMQESTARGKHMTAETFQKVLEFCREAKPVVVSITGGEPTEHPDWYQMVREVRRLPSVRVVTILTNGSWIENDTERIKIARLIRESKGYLRVQVYSNPKYYKNHEWTVSHEAQFRSIGCTPTFNDPIFMQDLGRARKNCQAEVEESDHVPSCINSHLIAVQAPDFRHFFAMAAMAAKFCRPLIDPDGGIHMSESWCCPTVSHVSYGADKAYLMMRASRPCQSCRLYHNFAELHPQEMELLK